MYGEKGIFSNSNFYGFNIIEWHSTPDRRNLCERYGRSKLWYRSFSGTFYISIILQKPQYIFIDTLF